jgi:hypothetical protein
MVDMERVRLMERENIPFVRQIKASWYGWFRMKMNPFRDRFQWVRKLGKKQDPRSTEDGRFKTGRRHPNIGGEKKARACLSWSGVKLFQTGRYDCDCMSLSCNS